MGPLTWTVRRRSGKSPVVVQAGPAAVHRHLDDPRAWYLTSLPRFSYHRLQNQKLEEACKEAEALLGLLARQQ